MPTEHAVEFRRKEKSLARRAAEAYIEWRGGTKKQRQARRKKHRDDVAKAKVRWHKRNARKRWMRADGTVDYWTYIASADWRKRKEKLFKKRGKKCEICSSTHEVAVHHKSYKNLGHELDDDLQILCNGCHANAHEEDSPTAADPLTREFRAMFA